MQTFCDIANVFTVTFNTFYALQIKNLNFFKNKSYGPQSFE